MAENSGISNTDITDLPSSTSDDVTDDLQILTSTDEAETTPSDHVTTTYNLLDSSTADTDTSTTPGVTETASTQGPGGDDDSDDSSGLTNGAIAGIAIGAIIAFCLLIFLLYCCYKQWKKRNNQARPMQPYKPPAQRPRRTFLGHLGKAWNRFTQHGSGNTYQENDRSETSPPDDSQGELRPVVEPDISNNSVVSYDNRDLNPDGLNIEMHGTSQASEGDSCIQAQPALTVEHSVEVHPPVEQQTSQSLTKEPDYMNLPQLQGGADHSTATSGQEYRHKHSATGGASDMYGDNDATQHSETADLEYRDSVNTDQPLYLNLPVPVGDAPPDTASDANSKENESETVAPIDGTVTPHGYTTQTDNVNSASDVCDDGHPYYSNLPADDQLINRGQAEDSDAHNQISHSLPNLTADYANLAQLRAGGEDKTNRDMKRSTLEPDYYNVEKEITRRPHYPPQ